MGKLKEDEQWAELVIKEPCMAIIDMEDMECVQLGHKLTAMMALDYNCVSPVHHREAFNVVISNPFWAFQRFPMPQSISYWPEIYAHFEIAVKNTGFLLEWLIKTSASQDHINKIFALNSSKKGIRNFGAVRFGDAFFIACIVGAEETALCLLDYDKNLMLCQPPLNSEDGFDLRPMFDPRELPNMYYYMAQPAFFECVSTETKISLLRMDGYLVGDAPVKAALSDIGGVDIKLLEFLVEVFKEWKWRGDHFILGLWDSRASSLFPTSRNAGSRDAKALTVAKLFTKLKKIEIRLDKVEPVSSQVLFLEALALPTPGPLNSLETLKLYIPETFFEIHDGKGDYLLSSLASMKKLVHFAFGIVGEEVGELVDSCSLEANVWSALCEAVDGMSSLHTFKLYNIRLNHQFRKLLKDRRVPKKLVFKRVAFGCPAQMKKICRQLCRVDHLEILKFELNRWNPVSRSRIPDMKHKREIVRLLLKSHATELCLRDFFVPLDSRMCEILGHNTKLRVLRWGKTLYDKEKNDLAQVLAKRNYTLDSVCHPVHCTGTSSMIEQLCDHIELKHWMNLNSWGRKTVMDTNTTQADFVGLFAAQPPVHVIYDFLFMRLDLWLPKNKMWKRQWWKSMQKY